MQILKKSKNNTSPGISGFTYSFYKVFWSDLKTFIINAMNHSFQIKQIPPSQSRGVISIIPKGNKDHSLLENWRPLTVLNIFYKLMSGVIASRINKILDFIIHSDQSGFVPKRFIGDCIRNTYDTIESAKSNNITGLLLLIDFKKAYDSISFKYIEKTLLFFGFGPDMITWINILLKNFKAQTIHAGNLSEPFNVDVGCRQGDPIASPLFLLSIEILCIKLRAARSIEWFKTGNIKILLSLYADDCSIFLPHDARYLSAAVQILENFYHLSGLQLQRKKTQVCIFGANPNHNVILCPELNLKWSQSFELLGISFSSNLENMEQNIWKKVEQIESIIKNWKYRFMSPIGRCVVAKSLLLSKVNHVAFAVPSIEKRYIKLIEKKYTISYGEGPTK